MEGSKYYKPEMEEIHPGFECEVMDNTHFKHIKFPEGLKDIQELKQYTDDMMKMAHADVRVKYLDREDIESLNWESLEVDEFGRINGKIGYEDPRMEFSYMKIIYVPKTNWCLISAHLKKEFKSFSEKSLQENTGVRFAGYVKNKSELRKLMSMLGIANSDKNT